MKRPLAFALACVLALSLAACGGGDSEGPGGAESGKLAGGAPVPVEIAKSQGGNPVAGFDGVRTEGGLSVTLPAVSVVELRLSK